MDNGDGPEGQIRGLASDVRKFIENPNHRNYKAIIMRHQGLSGPCLHISALRNIDCQECPMHIKRSDESRRIFSYVTSTCAITDFNVLMFDVAFEMHKGEVLLCMIKLLAMLEEQLNTNYSPDPHKRLTEGESHDKA